MEMRKRRATPCSLSLTRYAALAATLNQMKGTRMGTQNSTPFAAGLRRMSLSHGILAALFVMLLAGQALALIRVGRGNDPVPDNNWPAGSVELANLKTRVGWWEGPPFGGGQWSFLYRGDAKALQEALDLFAKIRAPRLDVFIHDGGPVENGFLKDEKDPKASTRVDWSFTVWDPRSWNQLYNNP
ncbi:MAG: hypothetical protein JWL69_1966, partial [Phycisphaerales bacterium]|nr:hypothetical protein [Phycisphaerales bacterium]